MWLVGFERPGPQLHQCPRSAQQKFWASQSCDQPTIQTRTREISKTLPVAMS